MQNTWTRWVIYGGAALCVIAAMGAFALPNIIQQRTLSPETINGARLAAGVLLGIAAGMVVLRGAIGHFLAAFADDSRHAIRQLGRDGRNWWRHSPWWHKGLLVMALVVGAGLRFSFMHQPIRTDEALTYLQFASQPLYLALTDYAAPNNHLLHTLGVHLTTRWMGDAEWVIRLTAFIWGVVLIAAAYVTMHRLYHKQAALWTAVLVAFSSPLIEYSVNARGYTLQITLILLLIALAHHLRRHHNRAAWALLVVCAALGFYTIPTMVYAFGGVMLWLLLSILIENKGENAGQARAQLLVGFVAASVATVLLTLALYTPVFIVSGLGAITGNIYVESLSYAQLAEQLPDSLWATWQKWHTGLHPVVMIIGVVGFAAALVGHGRIARHRLPLIVPLLVWIAAFLLVQRVVPFIRIWLFLLPLYIGMVGAGLYALIPHRPYREMAFTLLTVVTGIGLMVTVIYTQSPYTSLETGTFRDAEAVALWLDEQAASDAKAIYEHPSGESLRYYALRHDVPVGLIERDFRAYPVLYVIVNTEYAQDVASVLRENQIDRQLYGAAQAVAQFDDAVIYRLGYGD